MSWNTLDRFAPTAFGLGLGAAGGVLFDWLTLPLPWMTGSMFVTTAAALLGVPIQAPARLRELMVVVLGVMLGSAFNLEALRDVERWLGTLGLLVAFIALVTLSVAALLRRLLGYDPATAYFAAAPGGLTEMMLMGQAMGGDDRTIALVHGVRLLLTVFTIPFWFRLFGGYAPGAAATLGRVVDLDPFEVAVLAACAVAGAGLAQRIRLPAPYFFGPMLLSAAAHMAGFVEAAPPREAVNLAQLVIGVSVGCRFGGVPIARVLGTLLAGVGVTVYMLALAVAFAAAGANLTGFPFAAVLLAFAPGGLPEMTLISLALAIDPAFVATHHLARMVVLYAVAPVAFRLLVRAAGARPPASGERPPPPG